MKRAEKEESISIEDAVISCKDFKITRYLYFKRLNYEGVPRFNQYSAKNCSKFVCMNREDFVLKMFHILRKENNIFYKFNSLVKYVRFLDQHGRHIEFTDENIKDYFDHFVGQLSNQTLMLDKSFFIFIATKLNKHHLIKTITTIAQDNEINLRKDRTKEAENSEPLHIQSVDLNNNQGSSDFQQNKKRKQSETKKAKGKIVPLKLEDAVLRLGNTTNGSNYTLYFYRLNFKHCPSLTGKNNKYKHLEENEKNMHRTAFVYNMFDLFQDMTGAPDTIYKLFLELTDYVRYLDKENIVIEFNKDNIQKYLTHLEERQQRGEILKSTKVVTIRKLKTLFKKLDRYDLAREIPKQKKQSPATHNALDNDDLAKIIARLHYAYKNYIPFLLQKKVPDRKYTYMLEELKELSPDRVDSILKADAGFRGSTSAYINEITSIAYMLTSLWTGANTSVLSNLRRNEISFISKGTGHYEFDTKKMRAKYQKQLISIGFNNATKNFIENWLYVSQKITEEPEEPFFPFLNRNGEISTTSYLYDQPQAPVNKIFKLIGFPVITTSIFRQTRSDKNMVATKDYTHAAAANNNKVETTMNHYIGGIPEENEMQLAGTFEAQKLIQEGVSKAESINRVMYKFENPLTKFEAETKDITSKTTTGLRCKEPLGEKSKKLINYLKDYDRSDDATACTDFMHCFSCEYHAVVAEKDDIWLMLSFRDSLIDLLDRTFFKGNTSKEEYEKVFNTVEAILLKLKEVAPGEYGAAEILNDEKPHPLYADDDSINILQEMYQRERS